MRGSARRWFFALASALALVSLVISACGGGEEKATPAPTPVPPTATRPPAAPTATTAPAAPTARPTLPPPPTPTATPVPTPPIPVKRGGILKQRMFADPSARTYDTYDGAGGSTVAYMLPIMSNLIIDNQYKPGEAVGDLATSWTVSGDGLTYTFRMRSGVRYTDNTPLTSADVVWNFTQGWKPIKPGISNTQSVWSAVSDIKPVDPTTIQITLKQVSAAFLGLLSQTSLHIYPRHVIGDTRDFTSFAKNPIGSGAYYRSDFKPAVSWHMRANPAYYGKDSAGRQLPYLDGIDSFIILDNAAVNAAVRAGRIDVVDVFTGTPVRTDKAVLERELKYEFFLGSGTRFDLMLRNRPPWNNKVVRQALSMGIDRKLIVDTVELGLGTHLASPMTSPIQGGYWGLPADEMAKLPGFQQPHDADFQAAVKALRDNGVKEGTAFGYTVFIFFQRTGEVDVVATQLQKLGFKVALDIHTSGPAIIERVSRGDFDAFRSTAAITFDDPSQSITPFIGSGQGRNYGPWSFPKIDQLLAEQDKTLDVNKRRELLFEAQRLIIDEAAVIPVSYGASLMGWPPYVKNHPRWAFSFGPQWKYDQVWLDR